MVYTPRRIVPRELARLAKAWSQLCMTVGLEFFTAPGIGLLFWRPYTGQVVIVHGRADCDMTLIIQNHKPQSAVLQAFDSWTHFVTRFTPKPYKKCILGSFSNLLRRIIDG